MLGVFILRVYERIGLLVTKEIKRLTSSDRKGKLKKKIKETFIS